MSEGWFTYAESCLDVLRLRTLLGRQFLAEILGTFMLVLIGDGAIAQFIFFGADKGAGFLNVNIGYAFGLMLGIFFTASVSGGHLNPAVSLGFFTLGKIKLIAIPVYMFAQFLGAFLAAAVVFAVYYDAIDTLDGGNRTVVGDKGTAGIFATYPKPELSYGVGIVDQIVGTAILMAGILAITDKKNSKPPNGLEPIFIALTFFAVGISFGYNFGYGINPARDFGPRVFTALAGYGPDVWTPDGVTHWWLIPTFFPFIGAPIGAWIYYLMIGVHCESSYSKHKDNSEMLESQPPPAVEK